MFELFAAWGQGCGACAAPIEATAPGIEGRLCLACREGLPGPLSRMACPPELVDVAWCLGPYEGLLGGLIRAAKYAGREDLLLEVGRLMAERVSESPLAERVFDGMALVPGSLKHRLERGYDPVELLAAGLPGVLGVPTSAALRRRGGGSQAGVGHADRAANVRGVYSGRGPVHGDWLLVDDVLTTGATASACALALRESGARSVTLLVAAAT